MNHGGLTCLDAHYRSCGRTTHASWRSPFPLLTDVQELLNFFNKKLQRKAVVLLEYVACIATSPFADADVKMIKKVHLFSPCLRQELNLTNVSDFNIIMAAGEKLQPGLHTRVFGDLYQMQTHLGEVLETF